MPFGSVTLMPGVNVERTPTLLRAGISVSQLVRFKDALVQKIGGWIRLYTFTVAGIPRVLHAWEDLNSVAHLGIGTTTQVGVITPSFGTQAFRSVSPQQMISDFSAIGAASTDGVNAYVTITDPNISNLTTQDSVYFNVPFSIGGVVVDGLHPILGIAGLHKYLIATPVVPTADTTVNIPVLTTVSGSSVVTVNFPNNGLSVGQTFYFPITTTGPGTSDSGVPNDVSFLGGYEVASVSTADPDNFKLQATTQATSSGPFPMNNGNMEVVYYIALGPPPIGTAYGGVNGTPTGYGVGPYGRGGTYVPVTAAGMGADDWTLDNWGELLVACPTGGGIFFYSPTGGFQNLQIVSSAPAHNTGIFVSMSEQILVAFGSSVKVTGGWEHDPMLVAWSDAGDFTNWVASAATQAGDYRIGIGSHIVGGMAVSNQNLIWTDLDLWAMNYIGPPLVFGFNKIGAGAGLTSMHAAQQLRGSVYWMGPSNFYSYTSAGVSVLPCSVWDAVFQNLNTGVNQAGVPYLANVRAMPNTSYNEVGWLYPSAASTNGECDSYVKVNITEQGMPWDYGLLTRSAWIDHTVLGMPIATTPNGVIYQHETTNDADGQPLSSSFTTGYFFLSEGEDFVTVDQIFPDFKWNFFAQSASTGHDATISLTFLLVAYLGDPPVSYGPYYVTRQTQWLPVRFRGRQMAIQVQSNDLGSFWRLGYLRYRFSVQGRR